jgi:hypothetical protein
MKLQEGNTEEVLQDIGMGKDILDKAPKSR